MTNGVFNGEQPQSQIQEAPQTPAPATPDVSLFEKRLQDKDAFIGQIQNENAEMRQRLAELEAERRLEEARHRAANPPPSPSAHKAVDEPAKPEINPDELVERVLEAQERKTKKAQAEANIAAVSARLVETFGSESAASAYVQERAQALGVGVSFLQDAAASSPNAFYELIKLEAQKPSATPAPRSEVNPAALQKHAPGVKEGTHAYYENLRKQIGDAAFYTPKIQQQRFADRQRLGEAFYQ